MVHIEALWIYVRNKTNNNCIPSSYDLEDLGRRFFFRVALSSVPLHHLMLPLLVKVKLTIIVSLHLEDLGMRWFFGQCWLLFLRVT